ncbi:MAG: catechol 2,3-dioxygenase-like lactoylglutathione lyase family enzyme [Candidatus Azotimanducaceae bacterium]|jgi:catechol 2,3-dioxygenase-like lactoylglutathione lyase family enzyme
MNRPGKTNGMRHVAIFVDKFAESEHFYTELLGMEVEWRPDGDNVYLSGGGDNLALHRIEGPVEAGRLDHIGFFINQIERIDEWFEFLKSSDIKMLTEPRTHRDGARSFYCLDPSGVRVQIIYHPPIAKFDEERGLSASNDR